MLVAKNICLGLVAAVLTKPDICVDHFIKAITDVHDSGYFKLVCHLVRLLFPFGLESWHTIQSLSEVDKKETSSMGDQCFSNIMAFYYRAMLTKYLSDEKRRTTHDFEGSEQNCVTKNTGECSAANTIEHNNEIVNTDGTFTSCNEETNPTYVQHSRSVIVQTESELDSGVSRLHEGEMKETSFIDLYRIGLVCSTVLLSDIYAKFQKHKNDIEKDVPNEHLKDREDSGPKTEIEISLSVCMQEKSVRVVFIIYLIHFVINLFGQIFSLNTAREIFLGREILGNRKWFKTLSVYIGRAVWVLQKHKKILHCVLFNRQS